MRGRSLLTILGLFLATAFWAGDGGGVDAQKTRAAALESLVAAKQVAIQSAWRELVAVESDAAKLRESGAPSAANQNEEAATDLLSRAERRSTLEGRRIALLRQLKADYAELSAAQALLKESKGKLRETHQVLDGAWVLIMMPTALKGDLLLEQNGTLVSGEYKFENGMTGNVQGTLISNQLVLERIDAQYGRIGRLEAVLSKDGNSLQGTWYSYELTSGKPLVGALTIERPPPAGDEEVEVP